MKIRKLLSLLLIMLLGACSANNSQQVVEVKDDTYYLNKLENYVPRDKNKDNTVDNKEFTAILDEAFLHTLESDYIDMRDYLLDYESFGVNKPSVKWKSFNYKDLSDISYFENELAKLTKIDYSSLSYTQQFDYEKYEYNLYENILNTYYKQYQKPFSSGEDLIGYISINLTEFKFDKQEYLDDYFLLLADTPNLIDSALDFTSKQAADGIYLDNSSIDYSFEYAVELMGNEQENDLIDTFNTRVDKLDYLTAEQKESYKQKNKEIVFDSIVPALEKVAQQIVEYYDKASNEQLTLYAMNPNYARFAFLTNSSSNKDVDTLFNECLEEFLQLCEKYKIARNDEIAVDEYGTLLLEEETYDEFKLNDVEALKYLESLVLKIVPEVGELEYEISPIEAIKEGSTINAYFLQPALDNLDDSIMRTNPNRNSDDYVKNFVILAHEGLPGHMYQFQYYMTTNPHFINFVYPFIGYYEGWAQYAEMETLDLTSIINETTKDIYRFSIMYSYYLCTIGDIYYNYYGHTIEEFESFLNENGFNEEYASIIFDIAVSDAATDARYGIGYLEFKNMKQKTMEALGDKFDVVEFNKQLLVHGPTPLVILEKAIDDYIADNK